VTGSSSSGSSAAAAGYSKSKPYYARVVSVEGLCVLRNADDKDTVRLELQLGPEAVAAGGLSYSPGDALGIWPSNPPQVGVGCVWGGGEGELEAGSNCCGWRFVSCEEEHRGERVGVAMSCQAHNTPKQGLSLALSGAPPPPLPPPSALLAPSPSPQHTHHPYVFHE